MIIGSDFDGVIADDTFARISYVKKRYGVDIKADEIHGSKLAAKVGEAAKRDIELEVNCSEITMTFRPMPHVAEVFKRFIEDGDRIIIITGRTREGIKWARRFMKVHGIPHHHIWSSKEFYIHPERELRRMQDLKGKGRLAHSVRPAVFVEDSDKHLEHLLPLKDQVRLFLYNHPYNSHVSLPGVKRIFGWQEVYDHVNGVRA